MSVFEYWFLFVFAENVQHFCVISTIGIGIAACLYTFIKTLKQKAHNDSEFCSKMPLSNTVDTPNALQLREEEVQSRMNCEDWKQLGENVRSISPQSVILLSHKMPRIWQLMRKELDFGSVLVVSDFAISWMKPEELGEHVAVIDDAVNRCVTLRQTCQRLQSGKHVTQCSKFVISCTKTFPPDSDVCVVTRNGEKLALDDEDYRTFSVCVALALTLLSKPYEIEYPVLRTLYTASHEDFFERLVALYGEYNVHILHNDENEGTELYRYSVDLCPGTSQNSKLRFYVDAVSGEIFFVPMAHHVPGYENREFLPDVWKKADELLNGLPAGAETYPGESAHRLQQYMRALELGLVHLNGQLASTLTLPESDILCSEDLQMLFGPSFGEYIKQELTGWLASPAGKATQLASIPEETASDTPVYSLCGRLRNNPEKLEAFKARVEQIIDSKFIVRTQDSYFMAFFEAQWECVHGEFGKKLFGKSIQEEFSDVLPKSLDPEDTEQKNCVLRIGSTFVELLWIMRQFWESLTPNLSPAELHTRVSHLMDQHIDYGSMVPMLGLNGQRMFRKGEPTPIDRALNQALDFMGLGIPLGTPMATIRSELSPMQTSSLKNILKEYDTLVSYHKPFEF